jgi:hypothetical protein
MKLYYLLILTFLISCAKKISLCEQWEVQLYEKNIIFCPTGKFDTVTVCFNSFEHEDITGSFVKVDSVIYRSYTHKIIK